MATETARNRPGRVHGEFFSADATTAAEVSLFEIGSTTPAAVAAGQRIALLSVVISAGAAMRVRLFADADNDNAVDAGEALVDVQLVAGQPVTLNWSENNMPEGVTGGAPHVVGSVLGDVSVSLEGIIRTPTAKTGPIAQPTSG